MKKLLLLATLLTASAFSGFTAQAKTEDLSLMTFNLRGKETDEPGDFSWASRKKGCLKAIDKFGPDVICLQEAYGYHKADLMKEFKKYTLVDRSSKPGTVEPEITNNENPIMFRADKFELLDYGSFLLNDVRNITWVKLRYKKSGVIFFCFNTQFDENDADLRKSSEIMADKVKEIAGDDAVVFIGGDFKMSASDRAMAPLVSYVKDANFSLKHPDTRASFNGLGKPGDAPLWPDHILCRNAQVESYEVVDSKKYGPKYISDHYPIYAEFEIPIPKGK